MPEGHTLHRLARLHQKRFAGAPVSVSSPQGRFTDAAPPWTAECCAAPAPGASTSSITTPTARWCMCISGSTAPSPNGNAPTASRFREPVGQVRMRMIGAEYGTDLRGPTVCELLDVSQVDDVVARLGPDPLRADADPAWPWARITKSRRPIGALLMDQTVIAGVGNVYRSELLFRHRIDPYRTGQKISEAEFDAAWTDLLALMKVGLRRGKIVVVRPEHDRGAPSYAPGRPRTYVYRRAGDPCRVCGETIRTAVLEGRNVFWCPTCQT